MFVRPFMPRYIGHIVMMALALAAVHGFSVVLRRRPQDRPGPGLVLAGIVVTLVLIAGGIMAIGRPVL